MAYSETLAARVRNALGDLPGLEEKRMFGGVGFLVQGNMACGIIGEGLIVRVGPEAYEGALTHPQARPFDMTGRPMTGWVVIQPQGYADEDALADWLEQGVDFALTLPPK